MFCVVRIILASRKMITKRYLFGFLYVLSVWSVLFSKFFDRVDNGHTDPISIKTFQTYILNKLSTHLHPNAVPNSSNTTSTANTTHIIFILFLTSPNQSTFLIINPILHSLSKILIFLS